MTFDAVLLSVAIVLLPGLGAVFALYRVGELDLPAHLGLAIALGYSIAGLLAFAWVVVGLLNPFSFFASLLLITVSLWVLGLRRSGIRSRLIGLREQIASDRVVILVGIALVLAFAIVRLGFSPLANFGQTAPWRYWADAMEIADAGTIPSESIHYGGLYPPTVSKMMLNSFNAGVAYAIPGPLQAMGALTWLFSIGLFVNLWVLGRELGLRFAALLLPLIVVANVRFLNAETTLDLQRFTAENVGRMAAIAASILAVRGIRNKNARDSIAAGVIFAVAAGTHLVPTVIAVSLVAAYAAARMIIERRVVAIAKPTLIVGAVAAAVAGSNLVLARGDVGFEGAAGSNKYEASRGLRDPTRFLSLGFAEQAPEYDPELRAELNDGWYDAPSFLTDQLLAAAVGTEVVYDPAQASDDGAGFLYVVPGALVLVAVAMLIWFPGDLKHLGILAVGVAAAVLIATLAFSYQYETFVPARFGARRLHDYAALPLIIAALGLVEGGIRLTRQLHARAPAIVATVLVALTSVWMLPALKLPEEAEVRGRRSLDAIDWIRENIPCDSRILASRRTAGTFQAMTGRVSVTEGMTPFLRPAMLQDVTRLLLDATAFFAAPRENADFLRREAIEWVVVIKGPVLGTENSHMRVVASDALGRSDFLAKVADVQPVTFYRVTAPSRPVGLPTPEDVPGRPCRSEAA